MSMVLSALPCVGVHGGRLLFGVVGCVLDGLIVFVHAPLLLWLSGRVVRMGCRGTRGERGVCCAGGGSMCSGVCARCEE